MELIQLALLAGGLVAGVAVAFLVQSVRRRNQEAGAEDVLEQARREARSIEKDAQVRAKEQIQKDRAQIQAQMREREAEIARNEERVRHKEKELRRLENNIRDREAGLKNRQQRLEDAQRHIQSLREKAEHLVDEQVAKLESLSGLHREEAQKKLLETLTNRARSEAAQAIIDIKKEAEDKARTEAREILAFAIERMATDYTIESTLVSVSLPNDSWKGLIIGREGRNIKSFEAATGVKVIVDDTPETVVMSGFDPIKREIARLAMESLIKKKNINPKAIDQEVAKATRQVEESIRKAADETLSELKLNNVPGEMRTYLGRLKYRTSYGQNILQHSKEVAFLAGNMAAELGLDVQLARRAGLFHDIGKAVSNDVEGSHVTIGVEITEKFNEHPVVVNSVLAHHEEAEPISPVSVLVTAADRISGARPGARRESLEAYAQRISKLEEVANSFEGVAKTYALSAGREIRVMIQPEKLTDTEADMLASDIAQKIKDSMEYPGQIKVTVIRQLIATGSTDEFSNGRNGGGKNSGKGSGPQNGNGRRR